VLHLLVVNGSAFVVKYKEEGQQLLAARHLQQWVPVKAYVQNAPQNAVQVG